MWRHLDTNSHRLFSSNSGPSLMIFNFSVRHNSHPLEPHVNGETYAAIFHLISYWIFYLLSLQINKFCDIYIYIYIYIYKFTSECHSQTTPSSEWIYIYIYIFILYILYIIYMLYILYIYQYLFIYVKYICIIYVH